MMDYVLAQASETVWIWNFGEMTLFVRLALVLAIGMLIWDTVEVGRNDAANLVNAVFGARILTRRMAVWVAGVGVVVGAAVSSSVVETARKGIFDPTQFSGQLEKALAIYVSVYIVDTVLLYSYSAFGMPVSTTACLVFELLGAAYALGGAEVVEWANAGKVVSAIVLSIVISGIAGFMIQRAMRGAVRDRTTDLATLKVHGGWTAGGLLAGLTYFMLIKGMTGVETVSAFRETLSHEVGPVILILILWSFYAAIIHLALFLYNHVAARLLFPVVAVIGMICMGFAFGQNDLANCASPGLSALHLIGHRHEGVTIATEVPISSLALLGCGILLLLGMTTRNAQRVTRAAVNTGSMNHHVALYAPRWCVRMARVLIRLRGREPSLAPPAAVTERGKKLHYDPLRACVILGVAASVIATASSFGWPVSTTYVAFAAVVATGAADRILQRGDAELKLARTIWVVFSWFASAIIAAVAAGFMSTLLYHLQVVGMLVGLSLGIAVRFFFARMADAQERRVREQARDRMAPEMLSEIDV